MIIGEIKNKATACFKQLCFFFKSVFRKIDVPFINKKTFVISIVMIVMLLLPIFPFSTLTLAYEVKYQDKSLGYVSGTEANETEDIINNSLVDGESSADFNMTLVPTNSLSDADEISQNLCDNTNIVSAYGIYANKKCIAASDEKALLLNAIESYKSKVLAQNKADIVLFDKTIQIKDCLSLSGKLSDLEETVSLIEDEVDYKVGYYKTTKKTVKYKVVTKKDKTVYKGISVVKKQGKNGKQEITKLAFYKNGKKVSDEVIGKSTVKKVQNKVVVKGTKKRPDVIFKKGSTYAWPLAKGSSYYVSSEFGPRSGRLHKGIDIIADYGTKIVAAYDGVVTRASWFDSYGYCVDIRHPDGNVTRYAHCSSLLVSVGEQVVMGQTIAKVGCTGRSTANHLHFEVKPNGGTAVNPYNYVKY